MITLDEAIIARSVCGKLFRINEKENKQKRL
jgi:hypothetical protein